MNLEGKKVLVFGTGKSGIGATDLLTEKGADIILYDGNEKQDPKAILAKLKSAEGVQVVLGELSEEVISSLDLCVLSPGVPCDLPLTLAIRDAGVKIWGEVELAYQVSESRREVLAITGTNGKTTTTALLGEIMKAARADVQVVGNIGTPYTSVALDMTPDTCTVTEISSFQLETTEEFHPHASAITNITEDHLNRHHTMEEYIRVKESVTMNQTMDDVCVLNYEDPILREFGQKLIREGKTNVKFFSSLQRLEDGMFYEDGCIYLADKGLSTEFVRTDDLILLGLHNYENIMTAALMALFCKVPVETVRQVVRTFSGVEHRIEYVCEKNGVVYYNDSKGTNPDAAIKGIGAMNRPTWLIGGGYDKQSEYDEWIEAFNGKVLGLVLIGQTREKIAACARAHGFENIIFCEDLKEAVSVCADHAQAGQAVLLSPACASWGQFANYEQRGEMFKEYVRAL